MLRRFPWVNLLLFLATVASTLIAGAGQSEGPPPTTLGAALRAGLPFSAALLGILGAHELGHYVAGRLHRIDTTLPYFIPAPFGPIGTFGAFIKVRSAMPSRSAVLDVGAAGPLVGFAVALPLLIWGFAHSAVVEGIPAAGAHGAFQSPLALGLALLKGERLDLAPSQLQIMGDSLVTWAATRITHGPLGPGTDVRVNPAAFAAWIGMYVTTLNLIPVGQLDGGHVLYALLGRRALPVSRLVSWSLLAFGLVASWSWLVWWALIRFFVGLGHPPAMSEEPLGAGRRTVALLSLVIFAATFVPIPFYL